MRCVGLLLGRCMPSGYSLMKSFWTGTLEVLRTKGIVPEKTIPQAGSMPYWPPRTHLGITTVTMAPSSTSAKGSLFSGPSCPWDHVLQNLQGRLSQVQTLPPRPAWVRILRIFQALQKILRPKIVE